MIHDALKRMYDRSRPLVFGHRGAMAYAPMNTLSSFNLAAEQGADGIELDVWLSQDDVPVVMHDFDLSETTDGEGWIGSTPLGAIKELDAGGWFDPRFSGERVPTLAEVFEAVGQRLFVNIEIKSTSVDNKDITWHVTQVIRRHGMTDRVLVSSFNPFVLRNMRKVASDIPVGFLRDTDLPFYLPWIMIGTPYAATHPRHEQVSAALVAQQRRRGRYVNVWTVNEAETALRMAEMGVSGIITDTPDAMLAALEGH